jgi:hypothetical protein
MVSTSYNASVDVNPFPVLKVKLAATKDPEGENTSSPGENPPGYASPTVSLEKSEEPSALQNRMIDPVPVTAMQAISAPPANKRERIMALPP